MSKLSRSPSLPCRFVPENPFRMEHSACMCSTISPSISGMWRLPNRLRSDAQVETFGISPRTGSLSRCDYHRAFEVLDRPLHETIRRLAATEH
ncbi:hypothetical protein FA13DRAFT_1731584 [Coprinellus micaceus]|uniref:Uncharacterized protein n=1 Tax=Coprinellus micaceus TaxID=71717 RepID=A0A4Y7TFR2_COPMI|nr:hypothetical protein FA13DRAFT_1731584 [Coprinellus micaceus]